MARCMVFTRLALVARNQHALPVARHGSKFIQTSTRCWDQDARSREGPFAWAFSKDQLLHLFETFQNGGLKGNIWMDGNQIKMPFWDQELSQLHLCLLSAGHGIGHLHCLSSIEVILQVLDKEFPPQNTMMSLWGTSRLTILKNVNQIAAIQLRWLQGLCVSAGRSCQNVYQIFTRLRHSANCTWATVWSVMKHVSSQRTVYLCFG